MNFFRNVANPVVFFRLSRIGGWTLVTSVEVDGHDWTLATPVDVVGPSWVVADTVWWWQEGEQDAEEGAAFDTVAPILRSGLLWAWPSANESCTTTRALVVVDVL